MNKIVLGMIEWIALTGSFGHFPMWEQGLFYLFLPYIVSWASREGLYTYLGAEVRLGTRGTAGLTLSWQPLAGTIMKLPQPFPITNNPVASDPSNLWAPALRNPPLPTNTAWLNFVLNNGSVPEYIHPYLIQSKDGGISICYPSRVVQPGFVYQAFVPNLTIASSASALGKHVVSYYDDLSVSLELPGRLTVPLVRGSPYVTLIFDEYSMLKISSIHAVLKVTSDESCTKHKVTMNNGQTWLIYSSDGLYLSANLTASQNFKGVLRVALLTGDDSAEDILDRFSTAYPMQGHADLSVPFQVKYDWKKYGWGELLMLSLPMHRDMMSSAQLQRVCPALFYNGMDGEMIGVVGDCWILNEVPISVGWYSSKGIIDPGSQRLIAEALDRDVSELKPITTDSSYFYGKALARAARLALIAEEAGRLDLLNPIRDFLVQSLTPWMDGTFAGNAFLFDQRWGGLTSRNGSTNSGADFGFGVYNDHHYHLGYFCYAGAVLAKLDPIWGNTYKPHLYTMVEDYMTFHHHHVEHPRQASFHSHRHHVHHHHTVVSRCESLFPRLRNFDLWVLHSWAGGITEFADGRNQESTSEAVNAYYSAALLGLSFGDSHLINAGLTLAALEIRAAGVLWHIPSNSTIYEPEFVSGNRVVGVLWANKRDTNLWFAPAAWRECCLGIQLLPILPITEVLFQDVEYAQELVEWTLPALARPGVTDGWKGFVYALQAMYAPEEALQNVLALSEHDDGNSLSNLLWWIFSRWSRS